MMKILWIHNSSMMLEPTVHALDDLAECEYYQYEYIDSFQTKIWTDLITADKKYDLVFFLGVANGPYITHPATLSKINKKIGKVIHLCPDGGDPGWNELVKAYKEYGIKNVNIDGSFAFKELFELVTLTPPNPKYYKPKPWSERKYQLGFMGGISEERKKILDELAGIVTLGPTRNEQWGSYQQYADFMCDCKCVLNFARTGSNGEYFHVKNRVIETALAKAYLFEQDGSPLHTLLWEDYEPWTEWHYFKDILYSLENINNEAYGILFHNHLMQDHSAEKWFAKIQSIL